MTAKPRTADVEQALERCVAQGELSAAQAAAVLREIAQRPRRASPLAEAIGYLGGALAAVSAVAIATTFWDQLEAWAQIGVLAVTTVALVAGGAVALRAAPGGIARLGETLWLLAAATLAGALGVGADDLAGWGPAGVALTAGAGVAVVHTGLWRLHRHGVQQVPVLVGLAAAAVGALGLAPNPPTDYYGLLVWAIGVAWTILALAELLPPRRVAVLVGGVATLVGAQWFAFGAEAGIALGLATALVGFGVGARSGETALAGLAVIAVVVLLPQGLDAWFGEALTAPVALLVTGIALLGGALATLRIARSEDALGESGHER